MKLRNIFVVTVAVLLGALLVQLGVRIYEKPESRTLAMWKNRPDNMGQAKGLANQIVSGRVTKVEQAEDLVVTAPGEPNNEIHIPVEVVTIAIDKTHKGPPGQTVQVFHTGLSVGVPVKGRPEPPASERPSRPADGVDRPAQIPEPTEEESRTVLLPEDPAYQVGEQYVLLLMDGPAVKVKGTSVTTKTPISPEGRYRISADNKVEPVTRRGFAGQLRGRPLGELEAGIR